MNPTLDALFDEPEKRYLKADELNILSQYVSSLPERINVYRQLRNDELTLMQQVADALQQQFPQESEDSLKRSVQNGLLALRYAAMAMLMDNPAFVEQRLASWLPEMVEVYGTQAVDEALHRLLNAQLSKRFSAQQMAFLSPGLEVARGLIHRNNAQPDPDDAAEATLAGLF